MWGDNNIRTHCVTFERLDGGDHDNHSQQIAGANVLMRKVVENESKYLIVPWKATLLSVFFFFFGLCVPCVLHDL